MAITYLHGRKHMNTISTGCRTKLITLCKKTIIFLTCLAFFALVGCTGGTDAPKATDQLTQEVKTSKAPDGIAEGDYNALLPFLEWEDENGCKNGKMLNVNYSPDDVTTWTGVTFENGFIKYIDFNTKGLAGSLNLSGLERLECINVSNNMLTSICLDGLDALKTLIVHNNMLTSLIVNAKALEKLDFNSNDFLTSVELIVPSGEFDSIEQAKLNNIVAVLDSGFRVELSCEAQGDEAEGFIGFRIVESDGVKHYFAIAAPFAGDDAFAGWLDLNGDYSSKDVEFCLDDIVNAADGEQYVWLKAVFND